MTPSSDNLSEQHIPDIEPLNNSLLILFDICSALGSIALFQTFWPLQILGFVSLGLAFVLSVFLLIPPLHRQLIRFIHNRLPSISRHWKIIIKRFLIFLALMLLAGNIFSFIGTCTTTGREGDRILADWKNDNEVQQIELLKSAVENGNNLKRIYWMRRFLPNWMNPIPVSPLLALQKTENEIREINQLKLSEDMKITAVAWDEKKRKIMAGERGGKLFIWDSLGKLDKKSPVDTKQDTISSISVTLDGEKIATGGSKGSVKLWNSSDLNDLKDFKCGTGQINSMTFDRQGSYLAAGTFDKTFCLWDLNNAQSDLLKDTNIGNVRKIAFTPNSDIIAIAKGDGYVELRKLADMSQVMDTWKPYENIEAKERYDINDIAFNQNSTEIITSGIGGKVRLWPWEDKTKKLGENSYLYQWIVFDNSPNLPFLSVRFDSLDEPIAIVENQKKLTVNKLKVSTDTECQSKSPEKQNCPQEIVELRGYLSKDMKRIINSAVFGGNFRSQERYITAGSENIVRIWEPYENKDYIFGIPDAQTSITTMQVSPLNKENSTIYVIGLDREGKVFLWDKNFSSINDPNLETCHSQKVSSIHFKQNQSKFFTAHEDGIIMSWDDRPGDCDSNKWDSKRKKITEISVSPKNNIMAVADTTEELELFNLLNRNLIRTIYDPDAQQEQEEIIRFSPDGKSLVVVKNDKAKLWDVSDPVSIKDGIPLDVAKLRQSQISSVGFSPNKKIAMVAKDGDRLFLWDKSGKTLENDFEVYLEDQDGQPIKPKQIYGFSFSQNHPFLATVSNYVTDIDQEINLIQVWNWYKHKPIAEFQSSLDIIKTIQLSSDGKDVVLGGRGKPGQGEHWEIKNLNESIKYGCAKLRDYHAINKSDVKSICKTN
ncbi:WD40 repeat domain-containing protein [Crocosphaera sp.]|uniref:WD40 repeat domain-containing protein n=1 Tax=Crocosphaera sp. TaxID=2729996 RepID=UPI00261C9509|nr:WD40 repeat domain-containing protein [Crocosphaera sp.]MDJ0581748.1 WD40 repeat domain-containing protein [Crocosphaera sp.]